MSKIIDINEPWAGHTFKEIEDFVKEEMDEIQNKIDALSKLVNEED